MAKKYEASVSLNMPVKEAKQIVEKSLELSGFSGIRFIETTEIFLAETSVSLWSWSENISVKLTQQDTGTNVHFQSKCALATQIIDWGKNKKNTDKFLSQLNNVKLQ